MSIVLRIVGAVWALLGVANIAIALWRASGPFVLEEGFLTGALAVNMCGLVLPGLALYALGDLMRNTRRRRPRRPYYSALFPAPGAKPPAD
ncbi:MAG: hypothetical protein A2V88_00745 [Elusimicrobia bacterium RBG_16_66_12]|nr:MAG: hypothetical protein A2V88_00745 [Elusimicrobia bacterium RBG_16_66_12]